MEITHRNDRSQCLPNFHDNIFESERLNANIKLTLHKAFNVMTHACPAWKFAAVT
jgi:hypothetical protein